MEKELIDLRCEAVEAVTKILYSTVNYKPPTVKCLLLWLVPNRPEPKVNPQFNIESY